MKKLIAPALSLLLVSACETRPPEPESSGQRAATASPVVSAAPVLRREPFGTPLPRPTVAARPVAQVPASPDDPVHGKWALADAVDGVAGAGRLSATIDTDLGALECKLFDDKAPLTVANFVGLARGKRPWKGPDGKWVKKPAYDGTTFHRVIKGFMIQGGDAKGDGSGEPGYVVPDEVWEGAMHDRAGLLCMANRGPNTNGAQFFITDASAPHLDIGYTIFGECTPTDVVTKIASVEKGPMDRPQTPIKIKSVKISRK